MRTAYRTPLLAAAVLAGCSFTVPEGAGATDDPGVDAGIARDTDRDGVMDAVDDCPMVVDPEQRDHDGDHRGDLCDVCPHMVDDGLDSDLDGVGDACDPRPNVAGDRIAYFEGFYAQVPWIPVVGGNTWTFANGAASQPNTGDVYQLIRDDNPDLGHVTVEARFKVEQITGTASRTSAGIVTGYRNPGTFWFCGLASASSQAEVDAGKMSTSWFGDSFAFNLGSFADPMPGDWATLRARTSAATSGGTTIDCSIERNGVTGAATYTTGADASGDVGLRTNGAAASFDYVFVVASP